MGEMSNKSVKRNVGDKKTKSMIEKEKARK